MTNSKTTKRALFSSVVALLLCFTMLLGTTYAWFTDSAVSGRNIIQSGNLDVVLEYKTKWSDDWAPVKEDTKLFKEGALYEPGYTEVVFLRVSNAGSLALKYKLDVTVYGETKSTNVYDEEFSLKDHLEIGYYTQAEYNGTHNYADTLMPYMFDTRENSRNHVNNSGTGFKKLSATGSGSITEVTPVLAGDTTAQVVAIVLTMPETVGNEANHKTGVAAPTIDLGVTLLATQYTDEEDSFNNQYDKDALYPVIDAKGLESALAEGKDVKLEADIALTSTIQVTGNVTIDLNGFDLDASTNASRPFEVADGASLTINASDAEIVCGGSGLVNMTEGTLTINGGTFTNEEGNNGSFIKVSGDEEMEINLNNVNYKAGTTDSGVLRTTGTNVTVNVDGGTYEAGMGFIVAKGSVKNATITATNTANMWPAVYAGDGVTIEKCTIKSACHAIAIGGGETVTVKNCDVQVPAGKLAFQVFSSGGTINVIECTYNGSYGTTGKVSSPAVINIDGVEVYRKNPA